ncbi:MAG TPA: OsmC family protein [Bryobacteraceae bacterium]|nr:OsmC family protein [Bryobacteraceae bacterium]
MTVNVRYIDGVSFEAETRGHRVRCDQPPANGGNDEAMTPPEYLLVSLGTCAAFYAVQYLRTRQLPTDGLGVRVHAEKESAPSRLARFRIDVNLPSLDDRHRDGILRAVKSCLIHNTLLNMPRIDIHLNVAAVV